MSGLRKPPIHTRRIPIVHDNSLYHCTGPGRALRARREYIELLWGQGARRGVEQSRRKTQAKNTTKDRNAQIVKRKKRIGDFSWQREEEQFTQRRDERRAKRRDELLANRGAERLATATETMGRSACVRGPCSTRTCSSLRLAAY